MKVSIEVRNGADLCDVAIRAESIRRALEIVREQYPKSDVPVRFPIDLEGFFVKGLTARAEIVGFEQPKKIAA